MAISHENIDVIGRSKPRIAKKAIYKRPNCHCNQNHLRSILELTTYIYYTYYFQLMTYTLYTTWNKNRGENNDLSGLKLA